MLKLNFCVLIILFVLCCFIIENCNGQNEKLDNNTTKTDIVDVVNKKDRIPKKRLKPKLNPKRNRTTTEKPIDIEITTLPNGSERNLNKNTQRPTVHINMITMKQIGIKTSPSHILSKYATTDLPIIVGSSAQLVTSNELNLPEQQKNNDKENVVPVKPTTMMSRLTQPSLTPSPIMSEMKNEKNKSKKNKKNKQNKSSLPIEIQENIDEMNKSKDLSKFIEKYNERYTKKFNERMKLGEKKSKPIDDNEFNDFKNNRYPIRPVLFQLNSDSKFNENYNYATNKMMNQIHSRYPNYSKDDDVKKNALASLAILKITKPGDSEVINVNTIEENMKNFPKNNHNEKYIKRDPQWIDYYYN